MQIQLKSSVVVVGAFVALAVLPACARTDPCLTLPPPSAAELAAANSGADVEREIGSDECDLINGRWVWDRDSSQYHGTSTHNRNDSYRTTTKVTVVPKVQSSAPKPSPKSVAPAPKPSPTKK